MRINRLQKFRGDTLVEVLFATTIFSLVAVGSLSIVNQGAATSQRALEITLVRNEMDAQAETLRFLNSSYINNGTKQTEWENNIQSHTVDNVSAFDSSQCPTSFPENSFVMNTKTATLVPLSGSNFEQAITFAQVQYPSVDGVMADGIWIQAIRKTFAEDAGYIDFYIRACWDSPGQSVPVTLGTIVRLYEPIVP